MAASPLAMSASCFARAQLGPAVVPLVVLAPASEQVHAMVVVFAFGLVPVPMLVPLPALLLALVFEIALPVARLVPVPKALPVPVPVPAPVPAPVLVLIHESVRKPYGLACPLVYSFNTGFSMQAPHGFLVSILTGARAAAWPTFLILRTSVGACGRGCG